MHVCTAFNPVSLLSGRALALIVLALLFAAGVILSRKLSTSTTRTVLGLIAALVLAWAVV